MRLLAKNISILRYWAAVLANCVAIESSNIVPDQGFYQKILQALSSHKNSDYDTIRQQYEVPKQIFSGLSYFYSALARQMQTNATVHLSEEVIKIRTHKTLMLYEGMYANLARKLVKCLFEGTEFQIPKKKSR